MATMRMVPDPENPGERTEAEIVRVVKAEEPFSYRS